MNRVAVRSLRIVTNWIVPFLAQDGRAYRFAGEERGEVSGRCDDLHAYTGQQSRRAAIRCAEDLGQVPVGTGAEPYEKDIIDQALHVARLKAMVKPWINRRNRRNATVLVGRIPTVNVQRAKIDACASDILADRILVYELFAVRGKAGQVRNNFLSGLKVRDEGARTC